MYNPPLIQLALFALIWIISIYVINCLIAKEFKKINILQAILHVTAMAMNGVIAEVIIGNTYHFVFHRALWQYTVYPVHYGYTSKYAPFLWGLYGFHLYLLHGTVDRAKRVSVHRLALLFCLEAIIIEGIVNLTFKLGFGHFIYYYLPSDLWHFTSFQTLPFYLLGGYVVLETFKNSELNPKFYIFVSTSVLFVIAYLT
jgi:hypothetical protein